MSNTKKVNPDNIKIKVEDRSRGRMKITIKFSKEEAEAFKNFSRVKPEDLDDEVFYKQIFFAGCNALTAEIQRMYIERMNAMKESSEQQSGNSESEINES